jgi:protein TonB
MMRELLSSATTHAVVKPPASSIRVSAGVQQGLLISRIEPRYSEIARKTRIQGDVVLAAIIGRDGRIENLHVLSGHPMLAETALDAVKQWRYRPYMLGVEPVEVETQITVRFRLNSE